MTGAIALGFRAADRRAVGGEPFASAGKEVSMKKEEINEFMNMTLQEKKDKIIEIIREIPEDSPIHKELYETLKREMEGK